MPEACGEFTIMSEETIIALDASKVARIIRSLSRLYKIPLANAADLYYTSETAKLIEEGVADLQCRSENYLATLVWEESQEAGNASSSLK